MKYKVQIYAYYARLLRHVFTMAQYCSISFSIVRSNSSIVYVSDGCCRVAWLVALSALWIPSETGSFACVYAQSVQLVPLPVRNSVEVVAMRSRVIFLHTQRY